MLMAEAIREKCIYEVVSKSNGPNFPKWFKYMLAFKDTCAEDISKKCSEKVMDMLGISTHKVGQCYSKVTKGSSDLLDQDRRTMMELGVVTQPAITINNQTYRGELNGFDIFKGICNGFAQPPKFCQGDQVWELLMYDDDEISEIESKVAPKYRVIAAIVIAVLINLCLLFLYRRHQKKRTNEEL